MAEQRKYAILDTDFVSKANIIKSGNRVLADEVLAFPGYSFFCHQKMTEELGDHGTRNAQAWLKRKIASREIICYSDDQILSEMGESVSRHCFLYYRAFLKQGCELFDSDFYGRYFYQLDELMKTDGYNRETFLTVLRSCEDQIGHQKSYGEIKAFVLSQVLHFLYDTKAYIFCSDDFGARQGFANGAQISCISIVSVFLKMRLIGKKIEEVEPYFQSFIRWCSERKNPQTHVKVWIFRKGSYKRENVPIASVLADIYAGLYCARKDGDLQKIIACQ